MYIIGLGTHSIFWVENVRGGGIVNNDDIVELSSQPAEVFDIVPSVKNAGFSKEPCSKHAPLIQQVCHRVCILFEPNEHRNMSCCYKNKHVTYPKFHCCTTTEMHIINQTPSCEDPLWCKSLWSYASARALTQQLTNATLLFQKEAKQVIPRSCVYLTGEMPQEILLYDTKSTTDT